MVAALSTGMLRYRQAGEERYLFVSDGIEVVRAEVLRQHDDIVTVLARGGIDDAAPVSPEIRRIEAWCRRALDNGMVESLICRSISAIMWL